MKKFILILASSGIIYAAPRGTHWGMNKNQVLQKELPKRPLPATDQNLLEYSITILDKPAILQYRFHKNKLQSMRYLLRPAEGFTYTYSFEQLLVRFLKDKYGIPEKNFNPFDPLYKRPLPTIYKFYSAKKKTKVILKILKDPDLRDTSGQKMIIIEYFPYYGQRKKKEMNQYERWKREAAKKL
ncbi:MAG: hypothetical protein D6767_06775 [Candidatus Hydrogenedentota bacterium]|nr:MAG: hypothetical protein D6767_06775 [Candidatus Hydrogenedentota bacterium]